MPDRDRDDDELDDASLQSMRAVWLSMRDEDPPAAGMSALLAAASEKAEKMQQESPSWFQRMFAQLRRPPVLAFATVMILIGGAVLVTRKTANEKLAASTADDRPAAAELRVRQLENKQQGATLDDQTATPTTLVPVTPDPVKVEEPVAGPKEVVKNLEKPKPPKLPAPKMNRPADESPGKNEPTRDDRFSDGDLKPGFAGATEGQADSTVLETPGRVDPTTTAQPPPPPKKPAEVKTDSKLEGEVVVLSAGGSKDKTPPNEQLARQAESAASRGDCAAVRVIVTKLRKQDESFYKTRLGKTAAVTKCL